MKTQSAKTYASRAACFKPVAAILTIIAVASTIIAAQAEQAAKQRDIAPAQTFGRMFNHLPAFAPATDIVIDALLELGKKGGLMDANDDLAAGPIALITDP